MSTTNHSNPSLDFARSLDDADPLRLFRKQFHHPENRVYLMGNSLGLMSHRAERRAQEALAEWATLGVEAWMTASPPWFGLAERVGERMAPLLGGSAEEVVVSGATTVNIHALISTFYRPSGDRTHILADAHNFPTDLYALRSQIALRGGNPLADLVLAGENAEFLDEQDIIAMMDDRVSLVFLSAVAYRSGQLLDMERLARAAAERGIPIGFDCSHAGGVVPLELSAWGVDFAVCCSYKYLGGGPGSPAFLYVNRRHLGIRPAMAGWFGSIKDRQFDMELEIAHEPSARGFQIGTPPIIAVAAIDGALDLLLEAGIDAIREKSMGMSEYLLALLDSEVPGSRTGLGVRSPRAASRRGGHVALAHANAAGIQHELAKRGIVTDVRRPDTIRVAPAPLYNCYYDIWRFVQALKDILG